MDRTNAELKNVLIFALQNTEHGLVERGVFTYNTHIIEQTYTNENIKEMTRSNF